MTINEVLKSLDQQSSSIRRNSKGFRFTDDDVLNQVVALEAAYELIDFIDAYIKEDDFQDRMKEYLKYRGFTESTE